MRKRQATFPHKVLDIMIEVKSEEIETVSITREYIYPPAPPLDEEEDEILLAPSPTPCHKSLMSSPPPSPPVEESSFNFTAFASQLENTTTTVVEEKPHPVTSFFQFSSAPLPPTASFASPSRPMVAGIGSNRTVPPSVPSFNIANLAMQFHSPMPRPPCPPGPLPQGNFQFISQSKPK